MFRNYEFIDFSKQKLKIYKIIEDLAIRTVCRIALLFNIPELTSIFASFIVVEIKPENFNGKTIFAASHFRFRGEIETLLKKGFRVCFLNQLFISSIQYYFYRNLNVNREAHHNPKKNSDLFYAKNNLNIFYKRFLKKFQEIVNINILISPMAHYPQDMHIGKAAQEIGIPYIVLHRAGVIMNEISYKHLIERYEKYGQFKGETIIVQNSLLKEIFFKSGFCPKSKIKVIGSSRLKRVINKSKDFKNLENNELNITLFSFTHSIGRAISNDLKNISYSWTNNSNEGLVNFFYNVHKEVIKYALRNPEVTVNIKLKWEFEWFDKVNEIVKKICGNKTPENLNIISGSDGTDFINKSKVVIAFGSTVLIEAGLLGKHTIVPFFDEAADYNFKKYFPLPESLDICEIARHPKEISGLIDSLIYSPSQSYGKNEKMKLIYEKYLGDLNSNPDEKLTNYLKTF